MKPKPIKEILSSILNGKKFNEINETISIENTWKEIVGEIISNKTEIISLKSGTLTIKTVTPAWRNELSLQKQDIFKKIKKTQPKLNVKEIIFR